jgi:hypothetical protein
MGNMPTRVKWFIGLGVLAFAGLAVGGVAFGSLVVRKVALAALPSRDLLRMPRPECAWTRLADGRLLLTGGIGGDSPSTAEIYDPKTDGFSPAGRLKVPRSMHHALALPDGRVLLVGGVGGRDQAWPLEIEAFDPVKGSSEILGKLPAQAAHPALARLADGRILIAGMLAEGRDSVTLFDPKTGACAGVQGAKDCWLMDADALPLQDGRILFSGMGARKVNTALYDPPTEAFVPVVSMREDRMRHRTTLLADGRVFLSGGHEVGTCELFDPRTGVFAPSVVLQASRSGHQAVLLQDGRILLYGGLSGPSGPGSRSTSECVDVRTGKVESLEGPEGFFLMGAALTLPDGRVLAVSDMGRRSVFDPRTNRWSPYRP